MRLCISTGMLSVFGNASVEYDQLDHAKPMALPCQVSVLVCRLVDLVGLVDLVDLVGLVGLVD
jgi:hypothetical protein